MTQEEIYLAFETHNRIAEQGGGEKAINYEIGRASCRERV